LVVVQESKERLKLQSLSDKPSGKKKRLSGIVKKEGERKKRGNFTSAGRRKKSDVYGQKNTPNSYVNLRKKAKCELYCRAVFIARKGGKRGPSLSCKRSRGVAVGERGVIKNQKKTQHSVESWEKGMKPKERYYRAEKRRRYRSARAHRGVYRSDHKTTAITIKNKELHVIN